MFFFPLKWCASFGNIVPHLASRGGNLLGGLFSRVVGAIDRSKQRRENKRRILLRPTVLNKTISEALCLSLRLAEWTIRTKTSTRILNEKLP